MRLRRILIGLAMVLTLVTGLATGAVIWLKNAPRRVPGGQPALARLDARSFPAFRDAFNAAQGHARILVLLSPT